MTWILLCFSEANRFKLCFQRFCHTIQVCVLLCGSTINLPEEAYAFENGQKLINLEHFNCLVPSETSVSEMEREWEKESENEKKNMM